MNMWLGQVQTLVSFKLLDDLRALMAEVWQAQTLVKNTVQLHDINQH
jgi:hypothetical protein